MRVWPLVLLLITLPVLAIDETLPPIDTVAYPTVAALQQTALPVADRFELARRFLGVTDVVSPPQNAPVRQVGERETFFVTATQSGQVETVAATLRAVGEHIYVWLEDGSTVPDADIARFAQRFDTEVYQPTRELWGGEATPGIDGDPRLYALFTSRLKTDIVAYYSGQNSYPRALLPNSNEHDMLIFSLSAYDGDFSGDDFISAAAHEFQHMIRRNIDLNEQAWLDEAFSMLTEHLIGHDDNSFFYNAFLINPHIQLNTWGTGDNVIAEYGAGMLFVLYFYERYGLEAIQRLSNEPGDGLAGFDNVLRALGEEGVDVFFADWVLANALRRPETGYGYHLLPAESAPTGTAQIRDLPYTLTRQLNQYGSEYFVLENPPAIVTVSLTLPDSVGLIPSLTESGDWFWYALRGDESNPTLTRPFDLRDIESARLTYRIWYDLEDEWDYAYISVSSDGGQTWQPQATRLTTTANANGKAYGVGLTGDSSGWRDDALNLDAFAGQEILVRFEVISDDSVNRTGLALDDVRLEATGYSNDFNSDGGSWQAAGWIRADNRLPQRAWMQVVQVAGAEFQVTRRLAVGDATYTLDVAPDTQRLLLALSPFAPLTLVPVEYTLVVE